MANYEDLAIMPEKLYETLLRLNPKSTLGDIVREKGYKAVAFGEPRGIDGYFLGSDGLVVERKYSSADGPRLILEPLPKPDLRQEAVKAMTNMDRWEDGYGTALDAITDYILSRVKEGK